MKKTATLLFLLVTFYVSAQDAQSEINEQVWKPFTKAIIARDVDAFVAVHSADLIRVETDSKQVLSFDEYKKGMMQSWPRWKARNQKDNATYVFELRFTERMNNQTQAFEVGYFRNETVVNGRKEVSYGKFHVALRKENGTWKILVDSDSSENNSITEKEFLAAKPIW